MPASARQLPAARRVARPALRANALAAALAMTFGRHLAVSVRGIACAPPSR